MLSNASTLPRDAHYIEDDYSNAVFFGHPTNGIVSTTDTLIYINPEYRGIAYTVNIDIYMSNYQYNTITLSLYIAEETIPVIDDNFSSVDPTTPRPLLITEDIISNLKSKYNYVYSNQLQFTCNVIELNEPELGHSVVLDGDTLTVYPNLRGNSYTVQIIAYDPKFTSYAELTLAPIDDYCNLVNDSLIFTFEETPSIYFKNMDYSNLSKTISIYAPNNTQIECNLTDILVFENTANVYIIENLREYPVQDKAHYLSGNNSNAVYIGDFVENIFTIHADPIIYINPEYRGNTTYSVSFDIYSSNFATRKLTVTLDITEETIPVIISNFSSVVRTRPILLFNEDSISNLKSNYNYVYSNQLQFNYNVTELNEPELGHSVVLDGDTLTVYPNLRGNSYNVQIIAYDPNFTSYAELHLASIDDYCNLVNDSLIFTFEETPSIYFSNMDYSNLSNTISIYAPNNTQIDCNLRDILAFKNTANVYIIENLTGVSADNEAHYLSGNNSNAVYIGDFVDDIFTIHADPIIYINPEYRGNTTYSVSFDIYASNFATRKLTVTLDITEETIPVIDVNSAAKEIYCNLSNNEITIPALQSLYNYPFSNHLQFNYSNSESGRYDITLTESNLTVIAGLRDQTYTLTLQAYDPLFTYHHDINYVNCNLTSNTTNSNLINEELQFEFRELPAIRFKDTSQLSKTINIITSGNTQCNINLLDFVEIFTDHSNFMLSNASTLPRDAHYIETDYSNAVFFGHPTNGIVSTTDTLIYINPEYRGIAYTVNIDIYMSNYQYNTITLSLYIAEETIPVIDDNFSSVDPTTPRPLLITEDIISNLKSKYNYVYSNQLQFTCNVIELNEPELGHSVVLDGDTLTVYPNLRGNSYTVQIIAYDPKFTSYAELTLAPIDDYCNLINDSLTFTFEETPSIYFKNMDYSNLSKTISIYAPNNTQIECNLTDILAFENTANVYIIENLNEEPVQDKAYYLSGNNSNAVYIGDFVENIFTIHADPIIYINPEYRGNTTYSVSFDIYSSNFATRKLTVNLDITEDVIPVIGLVSDIEVEFTIVLDPIIIDNLADKYDYVYSNELVFTIDNEENYPIPPGVSLTGATLTITPELRNSPLSYIIIIRADEKYIMHPWASPGNSSLIFKIHEVPVIWFKDNYIVNNYHIFDTSQREERSYDFTFTQTYLTTHLFDKALEECNIIINVKESSSFTGYELNTSSNTLTIHIDNGYYEFNDIISDFNNDYSTHCNIDFEANLENYPNLILETTIRVTFDFEVKTLSFWFKLGDVNTETYLLSFDNDFYIQVKSNSLEFQSCNITRTFIADKWYNIALTYNNTGYDIYLDDTILPETIPYKNLSSSTLNIGKYTGDTTTNSIASSSIVSSSVELISTRSNHTMVVINGNMYIFGGESSTLMNDLYKMDSEGTAVTITLSGHLPLGTGFHTMVAIGDAIYIFGGLHDLYWSTTGDLFKIDTTNETSEKITLSGDKPSPRYNHTMVVIGDYIYIFGGQSNAFNKLNDLYKIDTDGNSEKINLSGDIPTGRYNHSMVAIGDYIYIFGGYKSNTFYSHMYSSISGDLYKIDTDGNSEKITLSGDKPSPRYNHTMVVIGDYIYIFGGYTQDPSGNLNDLYKIDTINKTSTKIDLSDDIPSPRQHHTMVVIDGNIYIFGGEQNGDARNDLYKIEFVDVLNIAYLKLYDSLKTPEELTTIYTLHSDEFLTQ